MYRYVFILMLLLTVAASSEAQPVDLDRFAVKFGVSPVYAIDRLGDLADNGIGGALSLEFRPFTSMPEVSFQITGHYLMLNAREVNSSDITIAAGTFDLKLTPAWQSDSRLYLFAGGGYGTIELKDPRPGQYLIGQEISEKKPLVEVGLGMERKGKSPVGFFVELAGVNIISDHFGDYRFGRLTFGLLF